MNAIAIVLGLLVRLALSVLLVAVVLLLAAPTYKTLAESASSLWRWPEVKALVEKSSGELADQADAADKRYEGLLKRPPQAINARLTAIEGELKALSGKPRLDSTSYLDLAKALAQGELESALRADLHRRILMQERDALRHLQLHAQLIAGRQAYAAELERRRIAKNTAKQREVDAERRVRELQASGWCHVPGSECHSNLQNAQRNWVQANAEAWNTHREWQAATFMDPGAIVPAQAPVFRTDRMSLGADFDAMKRQIARVASWQITAAQPVRDAFMRALQIVAAVMASAVAMKAFFFYVLAGLAERTRPVIVHASARAAVTAAPSSRSALSLAVDVAGNDELVVLGSHLQTAPDGSRTRTKWLFSMAHPLTSLAAGMWMLTRVRVESPSKVVVSSTTDPLEEVSAINLADSDSLVLQPRHLVGAVHPIERPVQLRAHWKFGIHAWLTLQFRYLVINGPCTLIIRGCRGIRVESTGEGRTLSQAMTVGFSPHLEYSVRRTETFTAYLLGQRPLFNDRLWGPGIVLYQEVPSTAQRAGLTGRGLQGLLDGAMKAFGL